MLAAWSVGRVLNGTLPSLLFLVSSALAWLVLGIMLVTVALLLRTAVR